MHRKIWIETSERKRHKAGLKAVTINAAVWNPEMASCIPDFVPNLFRMQILTVFYLHCQLRATSRQSPHTYFFLCIVPRNVLEWTLKGLVVKTQTNHPGTITWVPKKCEYEGSGLTQVTQDSSCECSNQHMAP
jgi:hypothetical protein